MRPTLPPSLLRSAGWPPVLLVAYPEPAASLVRAFRASRALADMAIGDPAGRAEFSGWSQILGVDGLGVSFIRDLPGRLGRAGEAIERRFTEVLGETPSFVAFEAYQCCGRGAAGGWSRATCARGEFW